MKKTNIERVNESFLLSAIQNRRVGRYVCVKDRGGVIALMISRNGHIRVGEFNTARDAVAFLFGSYTYDLFGNYIGSAVQ